VSSSYAYVADGVMPGPYGCHDDPMAAGGLVVFDVSGGDSGINALATCAACGSQTGSCPNTRDVSDVVVAGAFVYLATPDGLVVIHNPLEH